MSAALIRVAMRYGSLDQTGQDAVVWSHLNRAAQAQSDPLVRDSFRELHHLLTPEVVERIGSQIDPETKGLPGDIATGILQQFPGIANEPRTSDPKPKPKPKPKRDRARDSGKKPKRKTAKKKGKLRNKKSRERRSR